MFRVQPAIFRRIAEISPRYSGHFRNPNIRLLRNFPKSLLLLFLFTAAASASVTTYSNRSSYVAATGGYGPAVNIDFTTKDDGSYITDPGGDVYFDPLTLRGVSFDARSYYNIHIYTFPNAIITANLAPNTYAFGIDLSSFYGTDGDFTVTLSSGESYQITRAGGGIRFFGVTSGVPIQWAKFSYNNDYIVLDNFIYTAKAPYNVADGDVNGLIAAINAANASPGGDTINLAPSGTYTLTYIAGPDSWHGPTGLPIVQGPSDMLRESLTINGNGSTIQRSDAPGTPEFRIIHALYANVVLDSVVIKNGRVHGPNRCGGGGLYLNVSDTIIRNSTITENWADNGGGICNNNTSTLSIENSTISYNTGFGGRTGGGLLNFSGGQVSISNSTIYENRADGSPGFEGRGDSIADAFSPPGSIVLKNSILASPTRGAGNECIFFTPVSQGHNIFGDGSCGQNIAGGDQIISNLQLGPLANNGGLTPTHALLTGGPAIDAVPYVDCETVTGTRMLRDQRGLPRPSGGGCDIGAFELQTGISGRISYWPAEGNADDVIGPNNGTFQNGSAFAVGSLGQAFDLNGGSRFVVVPDSPSLSFTGPFTLSAMVYFNFNNFQQAIIEKYDVPGRNGYYFRLTGGKLHAAVCDAATCPAPSTGATTVSPGTWHHVAAVYDGTKMFIYLDGVLDGTNTMTRVPTDGGTSLKIGARGDDANTRLNGLMDEISIFDRALSPFEIASLAGSDSTPPVITPLVQGTVGNDGWYTGNVSIDWTVSDEESSVSNQNGCDSVTQTSDTTGTTYTCTATSVGGTASESVTIKRDAAAPSVGCAPPDGLWHAQDVSISCTSSDAVSGLASSGGGSFDLTSSVAAGIETNNASTGSHAVCDAAGNCAVAGPVAGNKVDKKAPTITIISPVIGPYLLNQAVIVSYNCSDGGSGVQNCSGSAANGEHLDTSTAGNHGFTVNATDNVGNTSTPPVVTYTVNYGISVMFDQTRAYKSGSTVPIKIRLVDANGANVSAAATVVHAVGVVQLSSQATPVLDDAGGANPDFDFRFDTGLNGYIFNLRTTGYGTGTYRLNFVIGGNPSVYAVEFQVRQ